MNLLKAISSASCIILLFVLVLSGCTSKGKVTSPEVRDTTWALLPFEKVDSVNPILSAGTGKFTCPIRKKEVLWEEKDVFNPAAVVRNDSVYLIYRAEDTIGKYAGTSRLGLAISPDGLHFTRRIAPVFYPALCHPAFLYTFVVACPYQP